MMLRRARFPLGMLLVLGLSAAFAPAQSVRLLWDRNEEPDVVEYRVYVGDSPDGFRPPFSAGGETSYTVKGLTGGRWYFAVTAVNAAGLESGFSNIVSTIVPADTTPPTIAAVRVGRVTQEAAVVTWSTDEPSNSSVEFGRTAAYGSSAASGDSDGESCTVLLTALEPATTYHFRVLSSDAAGNLAASADRSFTTAPKPADIVPLAHGVVACLGQASAAGGVSQAGLALVNTGTGTAYARLTALDAGGNLVRGTKSSNPSALVLPPAGQTAFVLSELFGDIPFDRLASVRVEASTAEVAGMFLLFDPSLRAMDGLPLTIVPATRFVIPETREDGFTRIAVHNDSADPATVSLSLVAAGGSVRQTAVRTIDPFGTLRVSAPEELFPGTVPDKGDHIRGTASPGVVPLEITGIPGADVAALAGGDASVGSSRLVAAQYAVGQNWNSALTLINLDEFAGSANLSLYDDAGLQVGPSREVPLPPRGKTMVSEPDFFRDPGKSVTQGWIEITGTNRMTGSISFSAADRKSFAASLPLTTRFAKTLLFPQLASNKTYFTGVAVLNPGDVETQTSIELFDSDGKRLGAYGVAIPPRARISKLVTELFPDLAAAQISSGYVKVVSAQPVAGFVLFGTNSLSVLSAVPALQTR